MKHRGGIWLVVAVILLVIGLLLRQAPLVLVAAILALVEGITRVWDRWGFARLDYHRRLSAARVFCGEEISLDIEVSNRKLLPLPWIEITDEIPADVTMLTGKAQPATERERMEIAHYFPLMWYERVRRRYRVRCPRRGYFQFGPTRASTGDLFGLIETETEFPAIDQLIVYPKIVPLDELGIPSAHLLGEVRARRSIHRDPILTLGVRDYHGGDSLKHIHWKTSARAGQLQTKVYEPSTSMDLAIFLDVRTTLPPMYGTIPHLTELGIVTAASLCYQATLEGYRVGLYINEWRYKAGEAIRISPSLHSDQLPTMLESLAKIHPLPHESMPVGTLVLREGTNLPWGSTIAVISAAPTEGLLSALHKVKRAGRVTALITLGNEPVPLDGGVNVFRIPGDIEWDDLKTISLRNK